MDLVREYNELLAVAFQQAADEGRDSAHVEALQARAAALGSPTDETSRRQVLAIVDELDALPVRDGLPCHEPSDLDGIVAARPAPFPGATARPAEAVLRDKLLGAWLGRCAGCMLGKPVEGQPRAVIEALARSVGAWPLDDYFPYIERRPAGVEFAPGPKSWHTGFITHAVRDDDTDYPIVGLKVLERTSRAFAPQDVADEWLRSFPYLTVYTAERVAYRNLVNGLTPPRSAAFRNPFREWIGAQIRADIWAWVNPGDPATAAEYAWRDASISHTRNGIYGELFFAAAIAQAFVTDDLDTIVASGLNAIPAHCRLADALQHVVEWCADAGPEAWEHVWQRIMDSCGGMHWIHTINNAMITLMAVLLGRHDFSRTISIAVMSGLDTDCNGATAGSLLGALLGAEALPAKWIEPLHDRLESAVAGEHTNAISELAERTLKVAVTKE
ncbi:MAG: ADP-ribosylglycohydrolase family protein [Verrucomicrobia bacterium]|nr:ADP-ribosylglycohydrolase family protein [Verrucomicrobiota bacterium]